MCACVCVKLCGATKIERRIFFSFFICVSLFGGDGKGEQRRQKHDRNRENFVYAFQGNMDLLFPFIVILNDIPKCTAAAIPPCIRVFGANDTDAMCVCERARSLIRRKRIQHTITLLFVYPSVTGTEHAIQTDENRFSRPELEWECSTRYDLFTDDRTL